jgi:hypothetical protein
MKHSRVRRRILFVLSPAGVVAVLIAWRTVGGSPGFQPQDTAAEKVTTPVMADAARNLAPVVRSGFRVPDDGRSVLAAAAGRLLIDGSVNPHAISDATAALILLPMIAPSPTGDAGHEKRRLAILAEAGYSSDDRIVLQKALAPLHHKIDEKRRQARTAHERWNNDPHAASQNALRLRRALAAIETPAVTSFARLERELSPDGAVKLRQHLSRIKSTTRILVND